MAASITQEQQLINLASNILNQNNPSDSAAIPIAMKLLESLENNPEDKEVNSLTIQVTFDFLLSLKEEDSHYSNESRFRLIAKSSGFGFTEFDCPLQLFQGLL